MQGHKIGIIAGGGDVPWLIKEHLLTQQQACFIIGLQGQIDDARETHADIIIPIEKVKKIITILQAEDCKNIVMAGKVIRPDFKTLRPDIDGAKIIARILMSRNKGDDHLLRIIAAHYEAYGFSIIAPETILSDLHAPAGLLCGSDITDHQDDITLATELLHQIGRFDIGQGVVVRQGQVIAIEAAEGTDAMLERAAVLINLSQDQKKKKNRQGVFVKLPKPQQERRIDLPGIGPETIKHVIAAGLAGIVFEKNGALLIHRQDCIALAEEAGIFIYGQDSQQ